MSPTMTRRRWVALDVVAAAVLAAPAVAVELRGHGTSGWVLALAVAIALQSAAVGLRTVSPLGMAATAALGYAVFAVVPGHHSEEPFVATLVVCFSVGAQLRGRALWLAVLLLFSAGYPMSYDDPVGRSAANLLISPLVLLGGPLLAGVVLRRSRDQGARLRRLSAELAQERERHARSAAAAERNRIARDLHDVISHSVTAMVVQAGAAEAQLDPGSPARAQVLAVRRSGKETLTELRRQLGVLRDAPA